MRSTRRFKRALDDLGLGVPQDYVSLAFVRSRGGLTLVRSFASTTRSHFPLRLGEPVDDLHVVSRPWPAGTPRPPRSGAAAARSDRAP